MADLHINTKEPMKNADILSFPLSTEMLDPYCRAVLYTVRNKFGKLNILKGCV